MEIDLSGKVSQNIELASEQSWAEIFVAIVSQSRWCILTL